MTCVEKICDLKIDPVEQIHHYKEAGKKVIGWAGILAPQELVHAAGMVPIGIWGKEGEIDRSKEYFPAFYASNVLRIMDMGLAGELDELDGMIITNLSDGLKGLSQNWKRGVSQVPMLYIGYGQNRKIEAGLAFNTVQYEKLIAELEKISGEEITDEKIEASIKLFNEHRGAMMEFSELASTHLNTITTVMRQRVFYSAFVYDKEEHLEILKSINEELKALPEEKYDGKKVVTTGIYASTPDIIKIFDNFDMRMVDDNIIAESGQYDVCVKEGTDNPVRALAALFGEIEGNTLLFDEKKLRGKIIADKVKKHDADGVVYLLTKFSESEEFDYPIIRKDLEEADVKMIKIEVDQQMESYEQSRTALQTFAEML